MHFFLWPFQTYPFTISQKSTRVPSQQTAFMHSAGHSYKSPGLCRRPWGPLITVRSTQDGLQLQLASEEGGAELSEPVGSALTLGRQRQRITMYGKSNMFGISVRVKGRVFFGGGGVE